MDFSAKNMLSGTGAAFVAIGLLSGCGGDSGYDVAGNVTFDGKPIPAGKIYFMPDGSKGNSGATGYAKIVNGAFDTSAEGGKPIAGGSMIVGVEGLDPSATAAQAAGDTSGEEPVKALFPYYKMPAELPEEDTTQDFNVPASAADQTYRPEGASSGGP